MILEFQAIKSKEYQFIWLQNAIADRLNLGIKGVSLKRIENNLCETSIKVMINQVFSLLWSLLWCSAGISPCSASLSAFFDTIRFYIPDCCLTSFAVNSAVIFSCRCLDGLMFKVNGSFKSFYVLISLHLLSVTIKKLILFYIRE